MSPMILSSDEIRSTSFGIERKGYNKAEVDSLLERVHRTISQLEENDRILRRQLESDKAGAGPPEIQPPTGEAADFVAIGEEVTAILQTARDSATTMRTTAETEARDLRQKAEQYAAECRRSAETDAEELRGAAALTAGTLRTEAQQDRDEAEKLLSEASEKAATLRAEAEQKASQVVEAAEQQAAELAATAAESAETEYRDALAAAQLRLSDAEATEQEILYSLTAVHSDVGAAIARLDHEARSAPPASGPAPAESAPGDEASATEGDEAAAAPADADGSDTADDADQSDEHEAETELERTTRQVTGGLAESLRQTAGVSGPVGALFGLSDADNDTDDDASSATPTEPDTIDLRDQPEAVQSLADSDDPLADLVKQAVGKAVERAAESDPDEE